MADKRICGMQAAEWSVTDAIFAQGQTTHAENVKASIDHPRIAMDAAHEARLECLELQVERDLRILTSARNLALKPGWSNQKLVSELFGLGWSSAARLCRDMGIDPEIRSLTPVKKES